MNSTQVRQFGRVHRPVALLQFNGFGFRWGQLKCYPRDDDPVQTDGKRQLLPVQGYVRLKIYRRSRNRMYSYPPQQMLKSLQNYFRERFRTKRMNRIRVAFDSGEPLSRFVAKDVRREILIVNIDELESGFILAREKSDNILYLSKNLADQEEYGATVRMSVDKLWDWSGKSWGGLSGGTSIGDHVQSRSEFR